MRHTVTLEFLRKIEVNEKMMFFNDISTAEVLTYTDIASVGRDEIITAYFSMSNGDNGRMIFEGEKIVISTMFSFDNLVKLNNFTKTHYTDDVLDSLRAETDPDYPPVEEKPPVITA